MVCKGCGRSGEGAFCDVCGGELAPGASDTVELEPTDTGVADQPSRTPDAAPTGNPEPANPENEGARSAGHPVRAYYNISTVLMQGMRQVLAFRIEVVRDDLAFVQIFVEEQGGGVSPWVGASRKLRNPRPGRMRELGIQVHPLNYGQRSYVVYVRYRAKGETVTLETDELTHDVLPHGSSAAEAMRSLNLTFHNDVQNSGNAAEVVVRGAGENVREVVGSLDPDVRIADHMRQLNRNKKFERLALFRSGWCGMPGETGQRGLTPPALPEAAIAQRLTLTCGDRIVQVVGGRQGGSFGRSRKENLVSLRCFTEQGILLRDQSLAISACHFSVQFDDRGVWISDGPPGRRGSTGGTWLNGEGVASESCARLRVGAPAKIELCRERSGGAVCTLEATVLPCSGNAHGDESGCRECDGRGALVLRRQAPVPECYAVIAGCLSLDKADERGRGWTIYRTRRAFLAAGDGKTLWLKPGVRFQANGYEWRVDSFHQFGMNA